MNALETLRAAGKAEKAAEMAAYHKQTREIIGLANPEIDGFVKTWRADLSLDDRLALAAELWQSDVFEARIAAAKLLIQARISPDDATWALLQSWVPEFDSWAIADHASTAAAKRLVATPARLDEVET